ncbi:MAG: hypothetical protein GX760_05355 [Erysipelothrix sp.]|nr:hypothetical protein [Erysipelothrix sp.]
MIYGEYEYKVENNIKLSQEHLESLSLMYQPLIGASALGLYLLFNNGLIHTNYSKLALLVNVNIEEIERNLILLERYRLIRTFKHKEEHHFIHQILAPILPSAFLNHYVYGLKLKQAIGDYHYNVLVIKYREVVLEKKDYVDISETKAFNSNSFDAADLNSMLQTKAIDIELSTQFDFGLFLSDASELKFPSILRTKENLKLISELALLYGISELRMATLVYRSIDYNKKELVTEKLYERVRREKVEFEHTQNKYDLPTIAFLQSLQNGAHVTDYNKQLLEKLALEMMLETQVINRLIEYVMETQNNRLVHNFVLQIASTWKAYDVKNVDDANKVIQNIDYSQKRNFMPEQQKETIKREASREEKYTDEEKDAISERWKKLGERYGSSNN